MKKRALTKKDGRGGARKGGGRPKGSGPFRETTVPVRVPKSLIPDIDKLKSDYLIHKTSQKDNNDIQE